VRVHQTFIGHDQELTTRGKTALQALFGRRVFAEPHSNSVKYGFNQRSSWLVVSSLGAKHRRSRGRAQLSDEVPVSRWETITIDIFYLYPSQISDVKRLNISLQNHTVEKVEPN